MNLTDVEKAALAEHEEWKRRLELERWTRYATDPDQALQELIAREKFSSPAQIAGYTHRRAVA